MKQVIVVRTDLKMSRGKLSSQVAHASIKAAEKASEENYENWEEEGMKKVILKVSSEKELLELFMKAKKQELPASLIKDAGKTQIEAGSVTAVGIGPAEDKEIDKITGHLKLL